jgi:tricorn protease
LKRLLLTAALLCLTAAVPALAGTHLMRLADVHDDLIVFTYEGDLWLVDAAGGDARRVTRHAGTEEFAKFSPDGSQLAFTAQYDGGYDVYVMPTGGGEPRRLTYHRSYDQVLDWCPDGKGILFRARRNDPNWLHQTFRVALEGGMPEKLPIDQGGLASMSASHKLAYNRLSRENRTWKRYQGGTQQDIWVANFQSGAIDKLTDWTGTDNYPMWYGEQVCYNSDREDGTLNLYMQDPAGGAPVRLTPYENYDVKFPSIGTGKIVYQQAEQLHLLDLTTREITRVEINVASDRINLRDEFVSISPSTGSFGLSPKGERVILEARGEIVNLPAEDGDPVDLTHRSASREKSAVWSPNGKWIAFISDRTGEEEIWLTDQTGGETKQLTSGGKGYLMQPVWSPDSKYLLYSDKYMALKMVNAESGKVKTIAQGEFDDAWERWGIQDYSWSPCSQWIAYSMQGENMHESIYLYSLDSAKNTLVTGPMTNDWSPSFSTDGEYLYFLSNRTYEPVMGAYDQNHIYLEVARPYLVLLRDDQTSPFMKDDVTVAVDDGDEAEESDEEKDEDAATRIDLKNIDRRILAAEGVSSGNYFRLEAVDGGFLYLAKTDREFIKYQNVNDHTAGALDLHKYALEDAESSKLMSGLSNYHLSPDGSKMIYRSGSTYGVVDAGAPSSVGDGGVNLGAVRLKVNKLEEFQQIFDEAWRIQRDWFYDPGMHGVDWQAMHDKYSKFVPECGKRSDLNYLIGELIGELNIGHTYIFGGTFERGAPRVRTGLLGADFTAGDNFYRFERIVPGVNWDPREQSPLAVPGCPIKPGHYLIAIDGETIKVGDNIWRHLEDKAGRVVTLTWNDKDSEKGAQDWRVETIGSEYAIRHREWIESNLDYVDQKSDGRIGYVYIPDMGEGGLSEFARYFYAQSGREALVIDERYNGGGFVGDMIIDRLERELWAMNKPREGGMGRNPERVLHGPIVVLINENTGSNGEYFAYALQYKKLATIMGRRTWGGAVGIEPHQDMVDGGGTTPPQFGPIGMDGTWIIEGQGVVPDIVVMNMPADVVAGKDAQLDAAIAHLLERLKTEGDTWKLPEVPDYPDKSK